MNRIQARPVQNVAEYILVRTVIAHCPSQKVKDLARLRSRSDSRTLLVDATHIPAILGRAKHLRSEHREHASTANTRKNATGPC